MFRNVKDTAARKLSRGQTRKRWGKVNVEGKKTEKKNYLCLLSLSPSSPSFPLFDLLLNETRNTHQKKPACYTGYERDNNLSNLLSKHPVYFVNLTEVVCNNSTPLVSASIDARKPKHRAARSSGLRQYCWTARELISL